MDELGPDWDNCGRVFDYGRTKYAEWNWAKGMPWSAVISSCEHHLRAMFLGEVTDPESGLPHSGHAMCNLIMLWTYCETYPEGDDRPPAELFQPRAIDHADPGEDGVVTFWTGPKPPDALVGSLRKPCRGDSP